MNSCAFIKACQAIQKRPEGDLVIITKRLFFSPATTLWIFCQTIRFTGVTSLRFEGRARIALKGFSPFRFASALHRAGAVGLPVDGKVSFGSGRPRKKTATGPWDDRVHTRSLINLSTLPKSRDERWESTLELLKRRKRGTLRFFSPSTNGEFYEKKKIYLHAGERNATARLSKI